MNYYRFMRTFLNAILGSLILSSTLTARASHNRIWLGYKLDHMSVEQFIKEFNQKLIPGMTTLAAGKGVMSYAPYIAAKYERIPSAISLTTYQSEEIYQKIQATPAGKAYSALQSQIFKPAVSKSIVPVQFSGRLEEDGAYELDSHFERWQEGETHLTVYSRSRTIDLSKFAKEFAELRNDKNINNSIIVITKHNIFEFRSLKQEPQMFRPLYYDLETLKHLKKGPIGTPIKDHDGINGQF